MKQSLKTLLFLFILALLSSSLHAQQTTTVVRVVDGDTLKVRYWGKEESVRLIGIKLCLSDASSVKVEKNIERLRNTNSCPGCELFYANLRGANLSSANLISANLFHADLSGANLTDAYLMHSYLNSAGLTDANLEGADLTYADLNSADLSAANLVGANLTNANLTNAYLSGANFGGANLTHAKLNNAEVVDTYFFGVKGLTLKQKKDLKKRGAIIETGETEGNNH
jgi:uncharacterized protein YjbI with pentapeptide repeats